MGRNACVRKTALNTSEGFAPKSDEMALTQKINRKKSRLSSVQPRNEAIKVWRCEGLRRWKSRTKDISGRIQQRPEIRGQRSFVVNPTPVDQPHETHRCAASSFAES